MDNIRKLDDISYSVVRTARKSLAIVISRDCKVTVRAPLRMSDSTIDAFIKQKQSWIRNSLQQQGRRTESELLSDEQLQQLKNQALAYISERVAYFSKQMNLYPSAVKVNFAKTRFGSCSAKNSLNFSAYLMRYPAAAVDYVIVHELAHIRHRNHGKYFYALIAKYLPDYPQRRAILRQLPDGYIKNE